MQSRNSHTRTLPVPVTEEERDKAGRDAAAMQVEIAKLKAEIDAYAKPRKETIKDIEGPMLVQAKIADSGMKDDKVECEERWLDSLQIVVVRLDRDYDNIVEGPRAMTKDETRKFQQQDLAFSSGTTVEVEVVDGATGEVTGKRKKVKLSPGSGEKN
jgi:hypothetical protein